MRKATYLLVASIVCLLAITGVASAGMLDSMKSATGMGSGGGGAVSRGDIDRIYKAATDAEALLQKAVDISFRMLASQDEIDKLNMRMKQIDGIQDPKEKEAELKKVEEDKMAAVLKASESAETKKKVASMDQKQKQRLGYTIYNLFLAGLRDTDVVLQSKALVQKIKGDPKASVGFAGDITKLTGIINTVPTQADKISTVGSSMSKLASGNKIEVVMPKTASEAPKETDNI